MSRNLWILLGLFAGPGLAWGEPILCDGEVHLRQNPTADEMRMEVQNACAAVVTVRFDLDSTSNVRSSHSLPLRREIPPGISTHLVTLSARDASQPWSYGVRFSYRIGLADPTPDPHARYRMPFGGTKACRLKQGVDGATSHRGRYRYAFDFAMPEGTPVLAARAGTVVRVVDGYEAGGDDRDLMDQSNVVTVAHEDGTFADYGHLRCGPAVELGDQVKVGDSIGWSGNTGFTTGPHLHFHVWVPVEDADPTTVPIRFGPEGSKGFVPELGQRYGPGPERWEGPGPR